jgi:hypothetical protein
MVELLEGRWLLSGGSTSHVDPALPSDPYVYAPHSKVEGLTQGEWAARWWQSVFASPVFAADGETVVNPQLVDDGARAAASKGNVSFLYGAFDGQDHHRGSAGNPINVPFNTPLFLPVQNSEWSNPDTPSKASNYTALPGDFSAAELAHFADVQTRATIHLSARIDDHMIPEATLFAHRETSPIFSYDLPEAFNIPQVFFGEDVSGRVYPAAADGYYLMLTPLSPGLHVIEFGGESVDLSATPPQLGASGGRITYVINVVKEGRGGASAPVAPAGANGKTAAGRQDELLGRSAGGVL